MVVGRPPSMTSIWTHGRSFSTGQVTRAIRPSLLDVFDPGVIPARLEQATAAVVRLDFAESIISLRMIVHDEDDLSVGDADEPAGVGRRRVGQRLAVDALRQLTVQAEYFLIVHRADSFTKGDDF